MWATASIRRNQVASADAEDFDFFQRKVSDLFPSPAVDTDVFMSIDWLRKLLDAFLSCEDEFKATLFVNRDPSFILKSPLDRLIPELLDRTVKSLDICNAITHGVDSVRFSQKHAEIAVAALQERPFTDGQIRRAKKSLATVLSSIANDEKESHGSKLTERSRSFGRRGEGSTTKARHVTNFRSLSWSVSKNWSAAKQIQAITSNLYLPRGADSTGLATPVYIMSVVLSFIMWVMVTAIPCQERAGIGAHGPVPKQPFWANGMSGLQDKIVEKWRKKEKKGAVGGPAGLMDEVSKVEKTAQSLADCLSRFRFPMDENEEDEVANRVADLAEVCARMDNGLGPLHRQIREVFHRIARSRIEVMDVLDQASKPSTPRI
ncbi:hypothetical protein V2J09_020221 [Rumex salicifolius]